VKATGHFLRWQESKITFAHQWVRPRRLSALSLMCIESELMRSVDFDDVINDFAAEKSRRRDF